MSIKLSVVGMCYGNAPYIIEALESIAPSAAEIVDWVVVDDGSPDEHHRSELEEWALQSALPIQLILSQENKGVPARLNEVLDNLKGDYGIFIGDDVFCPGGVDLLVAAALDHAMPDVVAGMGQWYDETLTSPMAVIWGMLGEEGGYPKRVKGSELFPRIFERNFFSAPATMWKLSALRRVGGYDERTLTEDWPMLMKLAAADSEFIFLGRIVLKYRRLSSRGKSHDDRRRELWGNFLRDSIRWRLELGDQRNYHQRMILFRNVQRLSRDQRDELWGELRKWFPWSRWLLQYSNRGVRFLSLQLSRYC